MAGYENNNNTGSMNSSADYVSGGKMAKQVYGGQTPPSDKASKMIDREPVAEGLKKNSMPDRERTDGGRSAKTIPDKPQKNGFDPMSRGK